MKKAGIESELDFRFEGLMMIMLIVMMYDDGKPEGGRGSVYWWREKEVWSAFPLPLFILRRGDDVWRSL